MVNVELRFFILFFFLALGQRVEDVFRKEPQYYDWIMKSDFPEYTKRVVTKLRYPDRNISF